MTEKDYKVAKFLKEEISKVREFRKHFKLDPSEHEMEYEDTDYGFLSLMGVPAHIVKEVNDMRKGLFSSLHEFIYNTLDAYEKELQDKFEDL